MCSSAPEPAALFTFPKWIFVSIAAICFWGFSPAALSGQSGYGKGLMDDLNALVKDGKKEEALRKVDLLIGKETERGNWEELNWLYTCKANLFMYLYAFQQDSVLAVFNDGLAAAERSGDPDFYLEMLMARTEVYQQMHHWDKTIEGWERALPLTGPGSRERSQVLERLSESLHFAHLYPDSVHVLAAQALRIARQLNDSIRIASVLEGMASRSKYYGNFLISGDQLLEALQSLPADPKYALKRISILQKLAGLFYETRDFQNGLAYARQGLDLAQQAGYGNIGAQLHELTGSLYNGLGQYDEAKSAYAEAYAHFRKKPSKKNLATSLIGLADVSLKQGRLDSAAIYLEKLEAVLSEKDLFYRSQAFALRGRYAYRLGNYGQSARLLRNAEELAMSTNSPVHQMRVLEDLQRAYRAQGNYVQALNALDKVVAFRDSLYDARTQQIIHENEARFQQKEQQQEITQLETDNKFKGLELEARRRQLWIGGIALLVLAFLSILAWRLYLGKREANRQLEEKNATIARALEEKEALLKEIHHRVKNNLQMISSLLSLQSRAVGDQVAADALREGRSRVKSMALIHQNLYQDENLIGIDLKSYMEKLAGNLFETYTVRPGSVEFITEIEDVKLDVEQVIPLGLIINELISNALKYAFQSGDPGVIKLTIRRDEGRLVVQVRDNGIGFAEDPDFEALGSLGLKLVRIFSKKLNADLDIDGHDGTSVTMRIPLSA